MPVVNLLMSTDTNHAPFAATVIRSVAMAASPDDDIRVYILTLGLPEDDFSKFARLAESLYVPISVTSVDSELVKDLPDKGRTKTAYLRIFAGELFPDVKTMIYLDTDVLVRCSLSEIIARYDGTKGCLAANDVAAITKWKGLEKEVPESFNKAAYFNSGVMLMNLDFFRHHEAHRAVPRIRRELTTSILHDQSALNVFLEGSVAFLPVDFNYMLDAYDDLILKNGFEADTVKHAFENPKIVHFSNFKKPWLKQFPQRFAAEYRQHLVQTPWGAGALPSMTLRNRIGLFVRLFQYFWQRVKFLVQRVPLYKVSD